MRFHKPRRCSARAWSMLSLSLFCKSSQVCEQHGARLMCAPARAVDDPDAQKLVR